MHRSQANQRPVLSVMPLSVGIVAADPATAPLEADFLRQATGYVQLFCLTVCNCVLEPMTCMCG